MGTYEGSPNWKAGKEIAMSSMKSRLLNYVNGHQWSKLVKETESSKGFLLEMEKVAHGLSEGELEYPTGLSGSSPVLGLYFVMVAGGNFRGTAGSSHGIHLEDEDSERDTKYAYSVVPMATERVCLRVRTVERERVESDLREIYANEGEVPDMYWERLRGDYLTELQFWNVVEHQDYWIFQNGEEGSWEFASGVTPALREFFRYYNGVYENRDGGMWLCSEFADRYRLEAEEIEGWRRARGRHDWEWMAQRVMALYQEEDVREDVAPVIWEAIARQCPEDRYALIAAWQRGELGDFLDDESAISDGRLYLTESEEESTDETLLLECGVPVEWFKAILAIYKTTGFLLVPQVDGDLGLREPERMRPMNGSWHSKCYGAYKPEEVQGVHTGAQAILGGWCIRSNLDTVASHREMWVDLMGMEWVGEELLTVSEGAAEMAESGVELDIVASEAAMRMGFIDISVYGYVKRVWVPVTKRVYGDTLTTWGLVVNEGDPKTLVRCSSDESSGSWWGLAAMDTASNWYGLDHRQGGVVGDTHPELVYKDMGECSVADRERLDWEPIVLFAGGSWDMNATAPEVETRVPWSEALAASREADAERHTRLETEAEMQRD